jgi:plasmid stabilization system protein ParE
VRLVVRDAAEQDISEAARWYEERSPGLGSEFLRAVDVTLAEIARMPERGRPRQGAARTPAPLPLRRVLRRDPRPRQRARLHERAARPKAMAGA